MESMPPAIRHEELLAQMGWVQSLAASLVRDPNVAQDVAQETWLLALERPPRATTGPGLRAWLATVTRTLARQSVRSESRRTVREQKSLRREGQPTRGDPAASDIVARGEMQRLVVELVMELDEPSRSTLLLRYLEGLSAAQIAEHEGLKAATVRKRLQRGLEQMRERFDGRYEGNRATWVAALMPLALGRQAEAAAPATALLTGIKLQTALLGLSVVAAVVFVWQPWGDATAESDLGHGGDTAAVVAPPAPPMADQDPNERPAVRPLIGAAGPLAAGPGRTVVADVMAAPPGPVHGQVVDLAGRPVGDLLVRFEPDADQPADSRPDLSTTVARTDADGRFRLTRKAVVGSVRAASRDVATLFPSHVGRRQSPDELLVIVAPSLSLGGHVLGDEGLPVSGARLDLVLPADARTRLALPTDDQSPYVCKALTDTAGRFHFREAARMDGAELHVQAQGYERLVMPLPEHGATDLLLELERPEHSVRGRVIDAAGGPVVDALVSRGTQVMHTDADGRFAFYFTDAEEARRQRLPAGSMLHTVVAVKAGQREARRVVPLDETTGRADWPQELLLQLGAAPLSMSGRVVDVAGRPLPDLLVWLSDPSVFSFPYLDPDVSTERSGDDPEIEPIRVVENILAEAPDESWRRVSTDAEGRFTLHGLLEREYTLVAMDTQRLLRGTSAPAHAGNLDVEIVVDIGDVHRRLEGRVVTRDGEPVRGARVRARSEMYRVLGSSWIGTGPGGVTDDDGRFLLQDVPRAGTYLRVDGTGLIPTDFLRTGIEPQPEGLLLTMPQRLDLAVQLADPAEADRFELLDSLGEPLPLQRFQFRQRSLTAGGRLLSGRSEVVSVTDAAAFIVFHRGPEEVRREALHLQPGTVNIVR